MKKGFACVAVVLLMFVLGGGAAYAQNALNPDASPNFGRVDLTAGFQPDPYIVTIVSGGDIDVATLKLGAVCAGFVSSAPDFNFERSGQGSLLRIFFVSNSGDTTLLVQNPAGQYSCNDDFEGLNPLVEFTNPAEGTYHVWVGSYTANEFNPGYLMASEQPSSPDAIISPILRVTSSGGATTPGSDGTIEGVQYFPGLSNQHVDGTVNYPQNPPAGGEHAPQWLTCGIYTVPVANENAVHSLEHGAVWITYRPGLDTAQIQTLSAIALDSDHRILSPYPGLPSPIVVSSWGYQLQLDSADDPRLLQFIAAYENGPNAPEPGAAC